jgi:hypothetical protein
MKPPTSTCKWNPAVAGQLCQCADCDNADGQHCQECSAECDAKAPTLDCTSYDRPERKGGPTWQR